MRKRDIKEGHWVRIRWDDVGARDALVVETDDDYQWIRVYEPYNGMRRIETSQVMCLGPKLDNVPAF